MIGVRPFGSLQRDNLEASASLADRAARTTGAHFVISKVAMAMNDIVGHGDPAASCAATTRGKRPYVNRAQIFNSLRCVSGDAVPGRGVGSG